ncbi:hypothetical protein ACI2LF_01520 [Kribbella sp. NPDC020789]
MTAQNHDDFQNDECRDLTDQAAAKTDPLGPITLPTRIRIGARTLALSGVVGLSAFAVAVGDPNTVYTTSVSRY